MAAHKSNPILKWAFISVISFFVLIFIMSLFGSKKQSSNRRYIEDHEVQNSASRDSASESLDTLTAQLAETERSILSISETNSDLKVQNQQLLQEIQKERRDAETRLTQEINQLKSQINSIRNAEQPDGSYPVSTSSGSPITSVQDLGDTLHPEWEKERALGRSKQQSALDEQKKNNMVPFYTIPANATAVQDRLMTSLVGRIPVKGVVTDPYPFKIVFSDNTLAANGFRIPGLRQMVVSGYTEGDLNLRSVRGWVTSLTFVFKDGTISTTSSNDNNIGKFSKDGALGYLSDEYGNPFIRGKLITNAPAYVGTSVALGAAQGAANAYAQSQTTTDSNIYGGNTSSVTGSQGAFVMGQAGGQAAAEVQKWWNDRASQSFDAIYVPTVNEKTGRPVHVAINFAKEVHVDYDKEGRKIVYSHAYPSRVTNYLE